MSMTLVSSINATSGTAAGFEFTSIPQTGTDLLIVLSVRDNASVTKSELIAYVNNDNSSYNSRKLIGTGSAVSSSSESAQLRWSATSPVVGNSSTASTFSNISIYISNYATAGVKKTASVDAVGENNATSADQTITAWLWDGTAAITRIMMQPGGFSGVWAQYSSASLYTITKGSGGATVS